MVGRNCLAAPEGNDFAENLVATADDRNKAIIHAGFSWLPVALLASQTAPGSALNGIRRSAAKRLNCAALRMLQLLS